MPNSLTNLGAGWGTHSAAVLAAIAALCEYLLGNISVEAAGGVILAAIATMFQRRATSNLEAKVEETKVALQKSGSETRQEIRASAGETQDIAQQSGAETRHAFTRSGARIKK